MTKIPIREDILQARAMAWERLAGPGARFTGAQRVALAGLGRAARAQRDQPPWMRELPETEVEITSEACELATTIAADAHKIDRAWAHRMIDVLGDVAYIEIVGILAFTTAADAFAEAMGIDHEPMPTPRDGKPDGSRPDGLADIGAHVVMTDPFTGPNVARALSLAPGDQMAFFFVVGAMYGAKDFNTLVWDRPLSRPQVELVAARVSSINECFY
jgi:hypothetical protein